MPHDLDGEGARAAELVGGLVDLDRSLHGVGADLRVVVVCGELLAVGVVDGDVDVEVLGAVGSGGADLRRVERGVAGLEAEDRTGGDGLVVVVVVVDEVLDDGDMCLGAGALDIGGITIGRNGQNDIAVVVAVEEVRDGLNPALRGLVPDAAAFHLSVENGAVDGLAVDVDAAPAIDAALERPIRIGGIGDENGVDGDLHLIEVNLVDGEVEVLGLAAVEALAGQGHVILAGIDDARRNIVVLDYGAPRSGDLDVDILADLQLLAGSIGEVDVEGVTGEHEGLVLDVAVLEGVGNRPGSWGRR